MNPDTTPTPEGWQPAGPCFVREYGGKLAVIDYGRLSEMWRPTVHNKGGGFDSLGFVPLADAVAWANEQLGVTKPVVVHEREFDDGSVLVWREDGKASARVSQYGEGNWSVDHLDVDNFRTKEQALSAAREYVRGGS
jgi:hypothetical protein